MAKNQIELRPTYWASFSGGKDSLYMLYYILNNLDRYPLDGVVHFELEIDYPFIKDVVDYVENELKKYNIPLIRIKPNKTWEQYYADVFKSSGNLRGYPTRTARWCSNTYKKSCNDEFQRLCKNRGCKVIYYIGFCANEIKRFKYDLSNRPENLKEVYPLAENGIQEQIILEWARNEPIYNDYYKYNDRCGCMCCPMASLKNLAYTKKYYPEQYEYFMNRAKSTEQIRGIELSKPFSVWASNPKYNTEYRMKRVDKILAKESETNETG